MTTPTAPTLSGRRETLRQRLEKLLPFSSAGWAIEHGLANAETTQDVRVDKFYLAVQLAVEAIDALGDPTDDRIDADSWRAFQIYNPDAAADFNAYCEYAGPEGTNEMPSNARPETVQPKEPSATDGNKSVGVGAASPTAGEPRMWCPDCENEMEKGASSDRFYCATRACPRFSQVVDAPSASPPEAAPPALLRRARREIHELCNSMDFMPDRSAELLADLDNVLDARSSKQEDSNGIRSDGSAAATGGETARQIQPDVSSVRSDNPGQRLQQPQARVPDEVRRAPSAVAEAAASVGEPEIVAHARKALRCLYIAVDKDVASGVEAACEQAFVWLMRRAYPPAASAAPQEVLGRVGGIIKGVDSVIAFLLDGSWTGTTARDVLKDYAAELAAIDAALKEQK